MQFISGKQNLVQGDTTVKEASSSEHQKTQSDVPSFLVSCSIDHLGCKGYWKIATEKSKDAHLNKTPDAAVSFVLKKIDVIFNTPISR